MYDEGHSELSMTEVGDYGFVACGFHLKVCRI